MIDYDIEQLLRSNNIKIERQTSSHLIIRCLSPTHNDSSPSLSIRKSDGYFKCFGCDLHGGPRKLYNLITGKYLNADPTLYFKPPIVREEQDIIYPEIKIYGSTLNPLANPEIRSWLYTNGIESNQFIKDREVQYSEYTEMGVKNSPTRETTRMVERICSPIYVDGKLINVEGRTYNGASPKVLYVKGGSVQTLYNWQFIDPTKDLVVVEGIKGLWRVWNVFPNVVSMFHAIPSEHQLKLLNTVKGNIILFRDNDEAGEKSAVAMNRGLEKEIKVCYSLKKHKDGKGYDPNDCSLKEIEVLITKAKLFSEDQVDRKFNFSEKILWE